MRVIIELSNITGEVIVPERLECKTSSLTM